MKIGIFDSGLGGLIIAHAIAQELPDYEYIYLGDTAHVPYGDRAQAEIYQFTREAVDYLFNKNCQLIILACNTASADALRKIQQEYLPKYWPDRNILGVLIPSAEEAARVGEKIGVIATTATVSSGAFNRELKKLKPNIAITNIATPLLVPIIEAGKIAEGQQVLADYLKDLKNNIDTLILGSTHYARLKNAAQEIVGNSVRVVSQDVVVPPKLKDYLMRHSEIETRLSKNNKREFCVTKSTATVHDLAYELMGEPIQLLQVEL